MRKSLKTLGIIAGLIGMLALGSYFYKEPLFPPKGWVKKESPQISAGNASKSEETERAFADWTDSVRLRDNRDPRYPGRNWTIQKTLLDLEKERALSMTSLEKDAKELGFTCFWLDTNECANFIDRVRKNPSLSNVLRYAELKGVRIFPDKSFRRGSTTSATITVDIRATDEEIVRYLTRGDN